ncbi:hypothetical protein AURANDRAFT_5962, partial [Aureococcus anophagefferens]
YIMKPNRGSEGDHIYLTYAPPRPWEPLPPTKHAYATQAHWVCQRYVPRPCTLDGFKFDLRLYVVITAVDPPRAYLCRGGLARLATVPYAAPAATNVATTLMHLTNYSLNRHAAAFVPADDDRGDRASKRSAAAAFERLAADRGVAVEAIWASLDAVAAKTVAALWPELAFRHRSAFGASAATRGFHLVGLDVLLDETLAPHVLECNQNPSLDI